MSQGQAAPGSSSSLHPARRGKRGTDPEAPEGMPQHIVVLEAVVKSGAGENFNKRRY